MLNVQQYLQTKTLEDLANELFIEITDYDDRVVLNYSQLNSPKYNPIVAECRGLILSKNGFTVLARSFNRFHNYGEDPALKNFDFSSAECYEKVDGSLITIYNDGIWQSATRKKAFAEGYTKAGNTFAELIWQTINRSRFQQYPEHLCFVCEFVSPETTVIKPYAANDMYLLTIVDRNTGEELTNVDEYAIALGLKRPAVYRFKSFDDIMQNWKFLSAYDEGYVFRDANNNRVKFKSPSYLAIAHMRDENGLNPKRIAVLVMANDYEEYLTRFEEDREEFQPWIDACRKMYDDIHYLWSEYHQCEKKDFALKVKDCPASAVLFAMKNGKTMDDVILNMADNVKFNILNKYKNAK